MGDERPSAGRAGKKLWRRYRSVLRFDDLHVAAMREKLGQVARLTPEAFAASFAAVAVAQD
jgi:hypothetical protein